MGNVIHKFEMEVNVNEGRIEIDGYFEATITRDREYGPDNIGSYESIDIDLEKQEIEAVFVNGKEINYVNLPQTTKNIIEAELEEYFCNLELDDFESNIQDKDEMYWY